jgi:hypothetical protein
MRRRIALSAANLCLAVSLTSFATAQQSQVVVVGPWTIATTYKADKFDSCTMNRSVGELGVSFVRAQDGLLLVLESQNWKLERGKAYPVRLNAGSQTLEARALAETKGATVALADRSLTEKLRTSNVLEVRGEGATLRIPLDQSAAALERLEKCFERNQRERPETNPFVAPSRRP